MKIVRILTSNTGGAGLCVQRLHNASFKLGINEKMLLADGDIYDDSIIRVDKDENIYEKTYLLNLVYRLLIKLNIGRKVDCYRYKLFKKKKKRAVFCTLPFSEYKGLRKLVDIERPDIINLHWISNFVDFPSFFKNIETPIVWSLHDENPMRGCLHYNSDYEDIKLFDEEIQEIKIRTLRNVQNMHIVVQSQYMKKLCDNSQVLSRFPITIIPNGVNPSDFIMLNEIESKRSLGIDENKQVFLFSSVKLEDPRKGLMKLIKALEMFNDDNIVLICAGEYKEKPVSQKIDIRCYGFVTDYKFYSLLYSAASFFILPSSYESFAKTPLEAMSCGTPVIAFPCSGTHDCIHDFNGVICDDFTDNALYNGICIAKTRNYDSITIRNYIIENFTFDLMAERYLALYKSILGIS